MPDLQTLFGWATSGHGRMIAAAALYFAMWAMKKVPFVRSWITIDSGWLTSKRKKMATNFLLALAPAVALLATESVPYSDVLLTALTASLGAAGIHAHLKAAKETAPETDSESDEESDDAD